MNVCRMMRGWTKKLYSVLSQDQEYKKRREQKEAEDAKQDGDEVSNEICTKASGHS